MTPFAIELTFFFLLVVSGSLNPLQDLIGWQAHSFNDLREFPQLIFQGIRNYKVDIHYQNSSKCSRYSYDKRGCLLLTHDPPRSDTHYFTSKDFILLIKSNAEYFHTFNNANPFIISQCFKPEDKFDPCQSDYWLSLVDDYFLEINNTLSEHLLFGKILFVMDGIGTVRRKCLENRFLPWPSTYIPFEDDADAFFSNKGVFSRFSLLDDSEFSFRVSALQHWGKFVNISYPQMIWEPDAHSEIEKYIDIYSNSTMHSPGLHFAINIDPSMFQIYSSSRTKNGFYFELNNGSSPLITCFEFLDENYCILLYWSVFYYYQVIRFQSLNMEKVKFSNLFRLEYLIESDKISSIANTITVNNILVILSTSDGYYCLLLFEIRSFKFIRLATGKFNHAKFSAVTFINKNDNIFVLQSYISLHNNFSFALFYYKNYQFFLKTTFSSISITNVSHVSAVSFSSSSQICDNHISFIVLSTSEFDLLGQFICIDSLLEIREISQLRKFDKGYQSSLSILNIGISYESYLLEIHTYGFCYNNHQRNTHVTAICDQFPIPSKSVLSYNIAPLKIWLNSLKNESLFNPCYPFGNIHGTFNYGGHSSASLVRDIVNLNDSTFKLGVLEVHEGIVSIETDSECGTPRFFNGIVLNAFSPLSRVFEDSETNNINSLNFYGLISLIAFFVLTFLIGTLCFVLHKSRVSDYDKL